MKNIKLQKFQGKRKKQEKGKRAYIAHLFVKIVKKKLKKKELTKEELKEFQNIRRAADIVLVYGKDAVLALAGRGIGPQTAARVLSMLQPTKEKLLKDILEAEKEFIRTKKYWKQLYIQYLKEKIPKQVLIGYMIEYIMDYYKTGLYLSGNTLDIMYNELEKKINELDR